MSERVEHLVPAPLIARGIASAIDGFVLSLPFYLATLAWGAHLGGHVHDHGGLGLTVTVAVQALVAVYEIGLVAARGQTLGKVAVKVRVVDAMSAELPTLSQAIRRYLPLYVPAFGLSLLAVNAAVLPALVIAISIAIDPYRRGLHDKAAGTIVVSA